VVRRPGQPPTLYPGCVSSRAFDLLGLQLHRRRLGKPTFEAVRALVYLGRGIALDVLFQDHVGDLLQLLEEGWEEVMQVHCYRAS